MTWITQNRKYTFSMMIWMFVYILSLQFTLTDSACTNVLPLSTGTWKTSNRGTWVVNNAGTQISGFEVIISTAEGPFTVIMACEDDTSDTDGYILLKSTTTKFALGGNKYIYACVKFTQSSSSSTDAFQYSLGSDPTTLAVGVYERIVLLSTTAPFSFTTKCTDKSTTAERTHMAIKDGTASSAAITCPTSIQGTFSYSGTSCTSTYVDICATLTQFVFNYTVCAENQFFSAGGLLHCVYSTTANGYNYLTLYNDDASPDGSTTYQYSCLVYSTSDTIVTASINPEECFDSSLQTPTSTVHPSGVTRTLTNYGDYPTSPSSSSLVWLYVLIAILIIIIIIVIIILVYCYLKRRKKHRKKSDEESLHPSVDEEQSEEEKKTSQKEEKSTQKEEQKPAKVVIKEEDRTSIDSGIEQEKKYEKQAEKDKKVVIEDRKEEKKEEDELSDKNSNVTDQNENLVEQKDGLDRNSNLDESSGTKNNSENDEGFTQSDNESQSNKNESNTNNNDQQAENTDNSDDVKDTDKTENTENEDKTTNEQNETVIVVSGRSDDDHEQKCTDDKNEIENTEKTENDEEQKEQTEAERKTDDFPEPDTDKKDEKQTRTVKIYETSEWNRDLEHQDKSEESGDNRTDQNPKIIKVKEQEEEKEQKEQEKDETKEQEEQEDEEEGSESEGSETSSRVTTPDPEEIERNIRKIGMKKTTDFQPQGELSKVLVSRKMEEESRKNKEMGKWKRMKSLFRGKTKKIKDIGQNKDNAKAKGEQQTDSDEEEEKPKFNNVTPFLEQYNYKKNMEKQLDEQHVWGGEEDFAERLKDSDDEEFANIFQDDKTKDDEKRENEKVDKTQIEMLDLKVNKSKHAKGKGHKGDLIEDITDDEKRLKEKEDQAKDSGVDSPDLKKEKTDINYTDNDEEMQETEMTEPPPGFIKDSAGRIIRLYDNKVMTEEEMQSIFPLARLGMLFHVPRLKRTSHGRPTGEYMEDNFGPKLEQEQEVNGDSKDDHPKAKHPRSSRGSARREQKEALATKTVAFLDDGQSDILMIDDDYDNGERRPSDANRELLRKRLFRNKRKPRSRGGEKMILSDEGRPRELSDLVRIIPQTGQKQGVNGRGHIPGTVVSRSDSVKNKYDPEQQQIYREGLAADKKILEKSPSLKRPPNVPKQAFTDQQDPDDIRISIDNEENEARLRSRNGINIGSDDEFFLVGNKHPEPLFTVRRHDQTTVRPLPGSDMFCPKHDMRHALPWSLINQYHIRESSVVDINKDKKETNTKTPKSADNAKRDIDDRRLRELLEELYKDKKYFDHMIDTTEPNVEPVIDERDLAEHGRDFLLERAEYWDERGVRIPRPPQSELGLRLSRMQTFVPDSGRVSNISYASTVTPRPHPEHSPVDKPKEAFTRRENTIS